MRTASYNQGNRKTHEGWVKLENVETVMEFTRNGDKQRVATKNAIDRIFGLGGFSQGNKYTTVPKHSHTNKIVTIETCDGIEIMVIKYRTKRYPTPFYKVVRTDSYKLNQKLDVVPPTGFELAIDKDGIRLIDYDATFKFWFDGRLTAWTHI